MVHICNHDAESTVELLHGDGGGVPIVYHHQTLDNLTFTVKFIVDLLPTPPFLEDVSH